MRTELIKSRESLRKKLLQNADSVIEKVRKANLSSLIEIGIFGGVARKKFIGKSDSDIYLLFDNNIPDRQTKRYLRAVAEENNCDVVFLTQDDFNSDATSLLVENILKGRIVLWRRTDDKEWLLSYSNEWPGNFW